LDIANKNIREQLKAVSWGQSQIVDASHLFVFVNQINLSDLDIDNYIDNTVKTRSLLADSLDRYSDFIKIKLKEKSQEEIAIWNEKQTYIALTNLINAAAELKIDVTPMEGFDNQKYNEILGLTELNLNACIVAAIGYRSNEDLTQNLKKVRKTTEDLFTTI
jgi:nitroreductase